MAHAALTANVLSRSKGRSSVAAAAYRAGEKLRDERTGTLHDYTRKGQIEAKGIEAPQNAPDWARDREALWNQVEESEKRKDAQVAREVVLILPRGLDEDQRRELVQGYSQEAFVSKGMVADWAIHAPDASDGGKNYHAHILTTMRPLQSEDFGQKNRDWNGKPQLEEWKRQYESHSNRQLEAAGSDYQVDLRSNKEKGIQREPQKKVGFRWARLQREAVRYSRRPDNPMRSEKVRRDMQEKHYEAVWEQEWSGDYPRDMEMQRDG